MAKGGHDDADDFDADELEVDDTDSVNGNWVPVKEQPALTETCSMSFLGKD